MKRIVEDSKGYVVLLGVKVHVKDFIDHTTSHSHDNGSGCNTDHLAATRWLKTGR